MIQRFKLTPDTGPVLFVESDSRDALVWERTNHRGRTVADLATGATMEDQYDLASIAARRTEVVTIPRKDFDATYLVEAVGGIVDEDPTRPAR